MARKKVIQARVSEEETELIEAYCAHLGVSISELIRTLILEKARDYQAKKLEAFKGAEEKPEPAIKQVEVHFSTPAKQEREKDEDKHITESVVPVSNPARVALSDLFKPA